MKRYKAEVAILESASKGFYYRFLKRPFDFLIASIALIALCPLLLVIAAIVKIKLGSPVIFQHKRPGKHEKIFTLYKFRSMTNERDENGELLNDSKRLTKFGTMLRSTSLDELPELWNIVRGDMAIVGPRPLEVYFLEYYNESERCRHDVRPGLTGLAQIHGRNSMPWEERFSYDLEYMNKITFWGDLKIIIQTVQKVLKREGLLVPGTETVEDFNIHRAKQQTKSY